MFSFNKGTVKLKEIDAVEVLSENNGVGIYVHLRARLKSGKTREIGGTRLYDVEKPHPKRYVLSLKLPSDRSWKEAFSKLKPDELKLALGPEPVSATWRFKAKE